MQKVSLGMSDTPEDVDYWRDQLKSHRRNSREIELVTWAKHAATLRGRAHYGRIDEIAEYVFQFIRTSEGELLKFGAVAFSKSEDMALARGLERLALYGLLSNQRSAGMPVGHKRQEAIPSWPT